MSTEPNAAEGQASSIEQTSAIEQGAYEVIKGRLLGHGETLATRANALNAQRTEVFGGTQIEVVGTERIRTENNCVPRDILAIGDRLLFGYNVFIGLKTETKVEDVFTLQRLVDGPDGTELKRLAEDEPGNFLSDGRFVEQFKELYRFYKHAKLLTLRRVGPRILAVFQVGNLLADVKVFRWAVDVGGGVTYLDNRGERDHTYPPAFDFEWTPTTREDHVTGIHGHISILDTIFVETIGGDLTIKIEDNTEDGKGVYSEAVDDAHQSLDDGQFHYAHLGSLILLKVLPYREEVWRHFVFNTLTQQVARVDNIGLACVQLPEDHGVIFPGGYYLQRGEYKTFDGDVDNMQFDQMVRSPNGEDVLYVFHRPVDGLYMLLPYNLIRKEVTNPIFCHGYSVFEDGRMFVFRQATDEPTRVHPMQFWATPFTSDEFAAQQPVGDSYLEKVGNAELVRGISDSLSIRRMIANQSPTMAIYEALIAATVRTIDAYYWLGDAAVNDLLTPLKKVLETAELIIDEFEKVQSLQAQARDALSALDDELKVLFASIRPDFWTRIDEFVSALSDLRKARGRLITTREMRYVDTARIDALETISIEEFDRVSRRAVEFMLDPKALAPYHEQIGTLEESIDTVDKVSAMEPLRETLDETATGLDLLTEVVGGLQIDDATVRTRILEGISEVMSSLNRTRALLMGRRKELLEKEGIAEFGAQFALFGQSVQSALALADTPEKCDEQLSRLMLQLEDLEARFSEFDQFLEQLATKREEVYEAFGAKKQQLMDQRQRRAQNLMRAAERILTGVARRAQTFNDAADLNAYFASDAMITKVGDISETLRELGDSVKADEVASRLKSSRENAVRSLRDKHDIFEDGQNVIRLGKHRFSVNTQPLDLTMVPRDGGMSLHLTGTGFYESIAEEDFMSTRGFWSQGLVSETPAVYRAEYLAACVLFAAESAGGDLSLEKLHEAALTDGGLLAVVRDVASTRYDEGYERGVHDVDSSLIVERLLSMVSTAGLLRYASTPRAAGCIFWAFWQDDDLRPVVERKVKSLARLRSAFSNSHAIEEFKAELGRRVTDFFAAEGLPLTAEDGSMAGAYLFDELATDFGRFVTSGEAQALHDAFRKQLRSSGSADAFDEDIRGLEGRLGERYTVCRAWFDAFVGQSDGVHGDHVALEATALILTEGRLDREVSHAIQEADVTGLLGSHPRIKARTMRIRLDEFLARLDAFRSEKVPAYRNYQKIRHAVLERYRHQLRLDEFKPRVLSSFVRNKLINDVYLPIFGDNLAKQLGALGAGKRTDLMGMLLLISPPGYGKTTLMEYIASRLGLVFMKINAPALGHDVHSLDPAEAPNATARQEVEKLNLALEMGNNVCLYLDDIQHTHPEFLQKFISLCDGQRRIEGVWRGRTRTYDLRGKKFLVCMAGNPYTESGDKFQIPDMLANRADVYNLGDILGGKADTFSLSYIENSLTSNPVLAPITTHEHADIYKLVRMAKGEEIPATELAYAYSRVELDEILSVLKKMIRCQEVLLLVNQTYIRSASMDDSHRTEPPFKLQGSYRNMNKLAEKLVAVMNDEELEQLIDDHYQGEAQTLTTGAEANLLKLKSLRGVLTEGESERWEAIKASFQRTQLMGGKDDDPATRVTGQLIRLTEQLDGIGSAIDNASQSASDSARQHAASRADQAKARAAQAKAAQAQSHVGEQIGQHIGPYLAKLDDAIGAMKNLKVDVEVVNTAPMAVHALLERQIKVMEESLLPVVRSLAHSIKADSAVWDKLSQVLDELKDMRRNKLSQPKITRKSVQPLKTPPPKEP